MKMIQAGLLAAAISAGFSGAAWADGGNLYAALDVGQATVKDGCNDMPSGFSCKDNDTAIRGSLGYQVNPAVGVELSYGAYGAVKANGQTASAKVTLSGWQVSAVGSLPVNESFSLTGKLGAAFTKLEESGSVMGIAASADTTNNTTLALGIGARYNISKTVALRAQYEDLGKVGKSDKKNLTLLSVGAVFGF